MKTSPRVLRDPQFKRLVNYGVINRNKGIYQLDKEENSNLIKLNKGKNKMGSFLCDENIMNDRKIQKLITEFGEGAGFVFIRLLAHVKKAQECCHVVFTSDQWFRRFEAEGVTDLETIKKIFSKFAELELIDPFLYKNEDIIFLPKYIKRHANYFKQLQRRDTYSGEILLKRLQSEFNDREHKDYFSLEFNEFILMLSEMCLKHDLDARICTSTSINNINNKLIYNDHINNNYIYNAKNKNFENEKTEKKQETKNAKNFDFNGQTGIKNIKPIQQITTLQNLELGPSKEKNKIVEKEKWKKKMATVMYENLKRLDPNYPKPDLQNWAKIFDLPEIKEREQGEIEKVLLYSQRHKYWYKKILTPYDLINNFTKIMLDMIDPKTNNANDETQYTYTKIAPDSERHSPRHGGEPVAIGDFIKQKFCFFEDYKKLMSN